MTMLFTMLIDYLVNYANRVIPAYDFEAETYNQITDGIASVVSFLTDVNFIVPLGDIATIILLTAALRIFKFSLFAGNWLVRRVCDLLP